MKNAVYVQSGGPTSVINASFYGVIRACQQNGEIETLFGAKYGIQGLIEDRLIPIQNDRDYSPLKKIPGAILGSARVKLGDFSDPLYQKILSSMKKHDIRMIFINGGNDSMDTADKLDNYFRHVGYDCAVVGIAKTIDNDLEECDFTPGFPSAVRYIVKTLTEIYLDIRSYRKGRVTIVEMMGRDAGWLCASSALANDYGFGPDLIYVPEIPFDKYAFLKEVKQVYEDKQRVLICVSEALKDSHGQYVFCDDNHLDSFGHKQLGSVSKNLCDLIHRHLHYSTRHIELNLMQRSSAHLQSQLDVRWAEECGFEAVNYAKEGKRGIVCLQREKGKIRCVLKDFGLVANKVRTMPPEFLRSDHRDLSLKGKEYFSIFKDDSLRIDIPEEFQ